MELVRSAIDYLNTHPEDLVALSGLLSVVIQYAINHVKALGKLNNALLGLIAIPGLTGVALAYFTSLHLTIVPAVAVLGQIIYHTWEALKRRAKSTSTLPTTPVVIRDYVGTSNVAPATLNDPEY